MILGCDCGLLICMLFVSVFLWIVRLGFWVLLCLVVWLVWVCLFVVGCFDLICFVLGFVIMFL